MKMKQEHQSKRKGVKKLEIISGLSYSALYYGNMGI